MNTQKFLRLVTEGWKMDQTDTGTYLVSPYEVDEMAQLGLPQNVPVKTGKKVPVRLLVPDATLATLDPRFLQSVDKVGGAAVVAE